MLSGGSGHVSLLSLHFILPTKCFSSPGGIKSLKDSEINRNMTLEGSHSQEMAAHSSFGGGGTSCLILVAICSRFYEVGLVVLPIPCFVEMSPHMSR